MFILYTIKLFSNVLIYPKPFFQSLISSYLFSPSDNIFTTQDSNIVKYFVTCLCKILACSKFLVNYYSNISVFFFLFFFFTIIWIDYNNLNYIPRPSLYQLTRFLACAWKVKVLLFIGE